MLRKKHFRAHLAFIYIRYQDLIINFKQIIFMRPKAFSKVSIFKQNSIVFRCFKKNYLGLATKFI
jgi:hypothetical protein